MSSVVENGIQDQIAEHVERDGQVLIQHLNVEADHSLAVKASMLPPMESTFAGDLVQRYDSWCP